MKCTATLSGKVQRSIFILISCIAITLFNLNSYGQARTYATTVTKGNQANSHVDNANNAIAASETSFARVNSNAGGLAGLGAFQGEIELKFAQPVNAGVTTFLRINAANPDLLNTLLGGSLGKLLANVLGSVVLGNRFFEAGARMNATDIVKRDGNDGFNTDQVKLIKDAQGYFYLAITPDKQYDRVYLKDYTVALVGLGATGYTDVYYAFTGTSVDQCAQAFATSYDGTGISLDLLKLGGTDGAGVRNAQNLIDSDPNNFSTLSLGLISVAGSISQDVYFSTPSRADDDFSIRLKVDPALVNVGLLNNISVIGYKDGLPVGSTSLSSLLGLDLLGLFNSGAIVSVPISPGFAIDRVKVQVSSLLNVSIPQGIQLYGVTRSAGKPTVAQTAFTICGGTTATLTATTANVNELRWYETATGGTAITKAYNETFTTPLLTATKTYYVSARRVGCTDESERVPVVITVNPGLAFATTTLNDGALTFAYSKQIGLATGGTGAITYTVASGSTLPAGLSLSSSGLITGKPTATGTFTFSIIATDTKGCNATVAYTLKVNGALTLTTATFPNGTVNVLYPTQTIPAATGGTGPYTYAANNLPTGLGFDPATRQITGTPTTAGTYNIPVTVTDANGNSVSTNYTIIVRDPLLLPTASLVNGVVGVPYPTQTIPAATGGNGPYIYTATGLPAGLSFDPDTRQITGSPTTAGTSTVSITAKDGDGKTITTTYTIKVTDPLVLATATLPDGTMGAVYPTQTIPAVTGGTSPYTYAATNVPAGLNFNSATRQITGTPTQSGSNNVVVTATDADGKTVSQTYVLKVNGELVLPAANLTAATVGTPYTSAALPAVSGGVSPYTYTATGLPSGLSFNSATRVISGTPTAGGPFTVTVTAKDGNGLTTSTDYALNVNVPAPVVAGTTTCAGTTATLTVSSPVTGVTYKWYAAAGNTSVADGTSFTTPALSATTTYYVEAVSGSGVSATRTAVTVTVNPAPALAAIQTPGESISAGQSVTLRANADAGVTVKWFAASTGGAALATGNTFNTPTLSATTTYYVGTESALGCASASRVPVTVTVTSGPANAACNVASTQKSGVDGICVLCGVTNPGNAIDGNANTFTRLNVALGVGASVYQQLGFATPGAATDFIRLDLATPVGIADLSVLGGITVNVYNGTTLVKSYPLNSNLLNLQLLSGSRFTATVPATGAFDRVEVRYGAVVSALTSLDIYSATIIYPTPTIANTGLSTCAGSTTTLTATPNGGTTIKWYASANSATALATGNTFTTPALTATTTYYIEVSKGTCSNPERVPVIVTVNPVINFATTTLPNASLTFTYGKQINVATGGTPAFKYAVASGTSLPAGLSLSDAGLISGTPTASGDFTFSIVATDSKGCTATTAFALKVTAAVSLPVATLPNGTAGTVYPTQTLPAATGGTGPFTYAAINVPDGLTFDPATRQISGTPTTAGTYTIPVTVTDANGNKASRDYTIIVRDPLVLPTATLADGTTGTPYATQTIPAATGGATPFTYTATGLPAGLTFDPATRQITGTPTTAGTSTVTVVAKDADGKTVTSTYTIKVTDPLVLATATLPDGTAGTVYPGQTIPAAAGGTGPYTYTAANVPNGLSFDPATRQITGTPTQSGSSNITVTAKDATGKTATQTYVLKVNGVLVLPAATLANGTVGTPYTSPALPAVTGGTSPYTYSASGLPTGLSFDPATRVISGTPTTGGTYTVTVTAKDNAGLTTSTDYALNINVAAPVVAGTTTCAGTTATLAVTSPITGVTYKWYAATGGTSVAEGATFTTPALTANTTYYVEAVSGTVVSATRTAVTVTVNPAPALATIQTPGESISAGQSVTLRAAADAGVTVRWFAASTGGTALATGTTFNTPTLTTTTTYYVGTESATGCASTSRVPVTVTVTSAPANAACNIASTQKSGVDGICVLCGVSNPGNAIDGNPNTFTRLTVAVGVGASVYQQLGFASQGSAADNIRLELASPVGLADLTVLGGVTVSVYNGTTLVKSYPLNSNLLNLQLLSGNKFTATVPATGIYDRVEIRYGAVLSALTSLDIYSATAIYAAPTVATTGLSICAGSATTLTATPNGGTNLKWYASANSATVLATGNTFTTPVLNATTTYYIEVSKGTCANTERVPVTVTVNPVINFAATTLSNASVSAAYSKQINVATGGTPAFKYTLASGSSLPAGLTLSETGVIGGTPTVSGDFTFSIVATDSKGCNATASFALKVTDGLALPAAALPNGTVGSTYVVQTLPEATGGTTPFTYAVTPANLPPGLTFDPATRRVSGVPTKTGTYTVPMTATDANGNKVSRDYTIIVRDPLLLPTAVLADGTAGTPYQTQTIPAATGGNSPYTYSALGVPQGLTFNPATREITGTPATKGTYTIAVTAQDGDGKTITTNYTLKVNDPLVLPTKLLANGTVGTVYVTETIPAATGGVGPYSYAAVNVPNGLNFDPVTRQITGTPTQSGSNNITVTVTDAAGKTATQTYVLKVNGVLVLPTATLANGTVGTPYTSAALPAVTGGTSPYTYTATGTPPGLTFDPATRVISGTPTTGGPYTVTVTAKDNAGLTTSTDYTLNVVVGAPVVAGTTTCAGTTATLAVTSPIAGVTYKWYASTGNTSIAEGTTFTTPALNANTTYYVEAVSGTAVSAPRTAVTVTVNPSPALPTVLTQNESISAGQSVTLQASADAGVTVKWFAAATGGTALATGASFNTPTLSVTTTYYVGTESSTGCASSSRVAVTVTVTSGPANPNCNVASTQKSGVDGICLLCGVTNPGNAIDGNPNTFTRLTVAVGVGASVYQQLGFANPGTAADNIRLELASPVGIADLTVLGGITVSVYNGTTLVKSYPLNSNLLNLQLLSGNKFTATVPATGAFDRVEVRYGALVSALTSLDIYSATVIYPTPTIAAAGQTICAGSTTTLTATPNGGTTLKWYASETSTTVLATGNTFTTPALTANTTYYIEVSRGTCANPERVPVTVTVTPVPTAPVVAAVAPVCSGSTAVLSVTAPAAGVVYTWYSVSTGGTALATGTTFTTPALTANTTYYVGAATGTCASPTRTAVNVTVNTLPVLATVTTNDANISAGQTATLAATAPAGTTIKWYAAPTNGTALATGPTFTTPTLTATTTYYVETSNASGCVSPTRVAVTVTVTGGPANPNCNAANSQQSGIEGICVLCSVQNPGNSVDNNFTNFTTISLPVGVGGSGYQRLIFPGSGVATDSVRLDLELPTGLADVSVLGGIKVTILNGTSVVKTYNLNSSLLYLQLLSGNRFKATLPATGVYDRVEVRAEGLVSALINLRIYGAEVIYPNPAVSADGQTICAGSSTKLSAAAKGGTTLRWYSAATGGTLLQTGENFTTPVLTATTTYYIEVSKGTCANVTRVPVTVTVTTAPPAPVVAAVTPVCSGSAAVLSVTAPVAGTTYKWYTVATGGTAVFTGSVFTTPALTASTIYYVEAANGTCVSATRTTVNATVNPAVTAPQVQASATTVNAGQTAILTATSNDAGVTFNWYTSAASTTPVFSGATYVTPPLTANTTYYVEAKSDATGCVSPSRTQVTITVNGGGSPNPVPCEAPTTQEKGVTGVALLADVFNPQLAVDNDTKTGSSLVMPVGLLGASVYQRVIFTSLSNVGDTARVLLSAPGKLLSLGILSNITVSTYNGATSNNDAKVINDPLIRLELLSGNTEALISFVPTQRFDKIEVRLNSGVAGLLTTVDLNYAQRVAVAPEVDAESVAACIGTPAILSVKNPKAGIIYKWYNAAGVFQANGTSFTTPAINAATRFFVEANTASGCASYRTPVNVTVTPAPVAPVLVNALINSCQGNTVTIAVSNPITGVTYKWYTSTGIYIPLQDGPTFTTIVGAAPTSFSVEAVTNCGTSPKTTATIQVGTLTPPTVTPASVTVSSGSPAALTATSSTAGAIFKWYDSPVSNTVLFTGVRYVTDPLINNTALPVTKTFYVTAEITGPGACAASARASVDVTILPNANPVDAPCEVASINVKTGVDGVALLTGVFNPDFAVDNKATTASSFVMPVGALGASVYQVVGFTGLSNPGDTVRLRISSPGKLLSLAVLPSIEVTTFNNGVSNNDMLLASNPIINLELLSDNSGAFITFVPQKPFNQVELRLRSGLVAALTTLDFNYAQRIITKPTVQAVTATACAGTSANLFVQNPVAGLTYRWYRGTTYLTGKDGVSLATDPTLAAGTYDFFVSATRNGCESAKTKVTVTILASPDAPIAAVGNPKVTCPNVPVTLTVNPVVGVTFKWYDALTGGTLLANNTNTYTTPANLSVGDHDFYVEAVNGNSCVSAAARTKITITVKPSATAADVTIAGANAPFCTGTKAVLTATSTTVTAPIFNWYSDAALTKLEFTGATFTTPELTANTTYYVTVSGTDKCENTAAGAKAVVLNLNPPATAADLSVAGATTPYCAGAKVVLTASSNTVTSPIFNWYSDKALTTLVFTGAEFTINSLAATTTYYVTVEGANKCKNLAADAEVVTVTVNPPALASDISVAGAATPFCKGAKATLTATTSTVTAPVFTWYSDADLKNAVYTGATFVTPDLTETTKYYVTVRGSNKCDNTAATALVVTVTVNPPATAADISVTGADAPFCAGSKATLVATTSTVTNPIFTWYSDADLKTAVFTGATFVTPVLTATKTYYVTVRGSNRCENTAASASAIVVTVNPPAVATDIAVAIDGAPFCVGTSARLTASSTTVTAPIFKWYSDAALTTLVFTGPVFDTPALTASKTYYVTVSGSNRCENAVGAAKVVTLTVNPPATAADIIIAGTGTPFCFGTKAILKASSTTVTNPVFTWYTDAALKDAIFTGAEFETPALTANTTYYVTVRGANKCDNLAADARAVALTVNTPATAADLAVTGGAGPFCAGGKATLNATTTTVTAPVFTWYSDAALTKAVFTGATFITPELTATTTYYVTVRGSNRCESTSATAKVITLIINPPAVAGDINVTGNETAFCAGAKATLKASSQTVTAPIFNWYTDAALTNLVFTGADFETPVLTVTRTYYVTVSGSNKCVNLAKDAKVITVTVNPPATAADVTVTGNNTALCAGTKATLTATSTTVDNPIFTWYSDAALTTAVFTGPVFETPVLTSGTKTYYVTVRGTNKCDNTVANAKIVTITVNPPATSADIIVAGANTGYCIGTKATLTATSTTVTTPVFTWYSDAALTTAVFTGAEFVTPVLTATTTYYVTVRGANKCDNAAADAKVVTVTVNTPATAADLTVTGGGTSVCLGSKATLVASTTTVTSPVFTWYSDADLTKQVYVGANFVTPALTETTTYYVTVRGSNKCETLAADAKVVTITVNPPAVAGDITVTGNETAFCAGAKATLKATSTTVNNAIFTWYSDAALTNQVFIGANFETPVLTATRTYYVTVTGSDKCANLAANAKVVTVTVNPPATASDLTVTGADAAFCAGTKATLTATSTTVETPIFTWYSDAALTTVAFTGPVFETPVLTANTTYYVTVRGTNKCENVSGGEKVITVKVNPPALATDIVVSGATNPFCAGATAVLTATSTTVDNPVFTWYSDAALTNAVFTGPVLNVPNLSTTTTYYVTVRGTNKCANTAATARAVTITVNPTPDVPVVATTGTTICSGEVTRLTVQNAQANVSYNWYSAATGGTLLFTGPAYDTQALSSTTDFYVLAVNASGCENATGRVKVTVTVSPKPIVPSVLSTNLTVCSGSRAVLTVSNPQTGVTYNWYTTAVGGTSVGTGVNFNTPAITTLSTYYVEASNATCVNSSRIAVTVNPGVIPVAPASVAGAANPLCAGTKAVLSVNNPDASLTYRWYAAQTGGTSLAEGSTFTTPNLSTTTTYYVESVNTASGCASPQRTAVVVTILPRLSAPVVTTQSVTATSITFTWGAVAGAKAYEVSLDNGVNWMAPSSGATGTTHLVKDLKPDQSVTIRVRAIGQLDCQLSDVSTFTAKSDNPFGNQVFIPNTFTPNNDGKNDILYVYATTISKMKLRIYNQWGQFLYESQNIQNGWDGTYKGTLQPNGVYVYLLEAEFNDGTKTTKKGTVTLLR